MIQGGIGLENTENINIWTDGSYSKGKCGCAIYIMMTEDVNESHLLYFNSVAKSSTFSELESIIIAIKYILYIGFDIDKLPMITIFTDEISIVNAYSDKYYKIWEQSRWKTRNGKDVKSNINSWYYLTCLVKAIPDDRIRFIYVDNRDKGNKLVHKYAKVAWRNPLNDRMINVISYENGAVKKEEIIDELSNNVIDDILKFQTPWEELRSDARTKYDINDISYINPCEIIIKDDKHINCNQIYFGKGIKKAIKKGAISTPIIVRQDENGFVLVEGIKSLVIAKLLNMPNVPCLINNMVDIPNIKD